MSDTSELASLRIERTARPLGAARRGRWRRWAVLLVVALALVLACRAFLVPPQVTVAPAVRASVQGDDSPSGELSAAGYIVADRQSTVSAKYTTRLARLLVREAAVVEKGQLLAELDHRELDAGINEAEADVARAEALVSQAQAGVAQAEAELAAANAAVQTAAARVAEAQAGMDDATRRLHIDETLVKAQAVEANRVDDRRTEVNLGQARVTASEQTRIETEARVGVAVAQVGVAKAARVSADAALLAARARLETLRARLEDHFVRAPFAGVVTERIAEEGEIVAPVSIGGTQAKGAIVTVIESASMQAEVDVAERHLARVKPGGRARITVDAFPGEVFPGSVQRILPLVDRGKATVKARVDFRKVDPRFLPNMAVRVRFLPPDAPAGAEEGLVPDPLLVPTAAVVTRDSQPGVWTVDGDRVRHVPVTTGATRGNHIEITNGLAEGATVVVTGAAALRRDGQRVRVRQTEGRL